jgi:hypothetical protein
MNAERANIVDKLQHGPCAKQYIDLEDCAADKKVRSHGVTPDGRASYVNKDGIQVLLYVGFRRSCLYLNFLSIV